MLQLLILLLVGLTKKMVISMVFQILNIGKGGLAVRTMEPIAVGIRISIVFRLPNQDREIKAVARIAWSNRQSLQGLQFEEIKTGGQMAIDEFVDFGS